MRILVAGDIHGDLLAAQNLSKKAKQESVDLVILSGDLTMFGKNHEGIIGSFLENNLKTMIIHGNHEDETFVDFLSDFYKITNLHAKHKIYDNIGFFACGGANVGKDALSETEIYNTLIKTHYNLIKLNPKIEKKIMITHVHPDKTNISKLSRYVKGSIGIRKAIEKIQPDILFCSHVHEAQGLEETINKTKIFCVGKESKIIDL